LIEKFRSGTTERFGCIRCDRCVTMMYTPGGSSRVLHEPNEAALNAIPARQAANHRNLIMLQPKRHAPDHCPGEPGPPGGFDFFFGEIAQRGSGRNRGLLQR
jgi:hypothetical protein